MQNNNRSLPGTANSLLECALEYASIGLRVHPLKTNTKVPITQWKEQATTDIETIQQWWKQYPTANIGIVMGEAPLNWIVLDVDQKNGHKGIDSLEGVRGGKSLDTFAVQTPSGGWHLYYADNKKQIKQNETNFLDGLDLKTTGGYVVAPPSVIDAKPYKWMSREDILPIPQWLIDAIAASKNKPAPNNTSGISQGTRNSNLFKIACKFSNKGFDKQDVLIKLIEINQTECIPPLDLSEVETIVDSACKRALPTNNSLTFSHTDVGNSNRFKELYDNDYRYVTTLKNSIIWNKQRWQVDEGKVVMTQFAKNTIESITKQFISIFTYCVDDAKVVGW